MENGAGAVVSAVLVSALVAAFVTLAIEYIAKPRLEVRKERILERHRQIWELQRRLSIFLGHMNAQFIPLGEDPRPDAFVTALQRLRSEIDDIEDQAVICYEHLVPDASEFVSVALWYARGFIDGVLDTKDDWTPESIKDAIDSIENSAVRDVRTALSYLRLPGWRLLARRNAHRFFRSASETGVGSDEDPEADGL